MSRLAHLLALAKLAARGARAGRGTYTPPPAGPRRRIAVEKRVLADAKQRARYLAATGAHAGAADDAPHLSLPPLFPCVWEAATALELLAALEPPLPLAPVLHVQQEHLFLRPLHTAEPLRLRVELERMEETRGGLRLTVSSRLFGPAGALRVQGTNVFLIRTPRPARTADVRSSPPATAPRPLATLRELDRWHFRRSAGRRYALASGDFNPIHLWAATARPFGFRRPILHGACLAAHMAHSIVQHHLRGDAGLLRRFHIAFRAPILLPARVRLLTGEAEGAGCFRVVAAAETDPVFAEGSFNRG